MNVHNYIVVTAVCRRAPRYKLLIGKKEKEKKERGHVPHRVSRTRL